MASRARHRAATPALAEPRAVPRALGLGRFKRGPLASGASTHPVRDSLWPWCLSSQPRALMLARACPQLFEPFVRRCGFPDQLVSGFPLLPHQDMSPSCWGNPCCCSCH